MSACLPRPLTVLTLVAAFAAGAPAPAAGRADLLRFVPGDHGFCLVVRDLRGKSADLLASPFAGLWRRSAVGKAVAGAAELAQLEKAEQYIRTHLGIGWSEIRDELFGDAFVFVYRPGPPGKPEQEQGLFLLRARNEKMLADLVTRLNELQKKTGELTSIDDRAYRGVSYTRRVERKATHFYLLRGPLLLFTAQEAILRQAIDCDRALAADAEPPLARRLRDLGLDRALAAVSINPRAFDEAVTARGAVDPAARAFAGYWKALEGIGLALAIDRDLSLSLTFQARTETLPAPARRFLSSAAGASDLWTVFPEDALFAMACRLDLGALYQLLGDFAGRASRQALEADLARSLGAVLGKDVPRELLPALGPDWGLCVTAPPADSKGWAPRALFALKIARGDEGDPTDQAILSAVHMGAQLAVLGHNKMHPARPIRLGSTMVDGVRVRYLHGEAAFPAGIQPAFGLKDGYLVLASSPARFRGFSVKARPAEAGLVPLLRLSARAWRDYVRDRREALAITLAGKEGLSKEKATAKVDGLLTGLELIDRVELVQKTAPGRVTFALVVRPAQPLKK